MTAIENHSEKVGNAYKTVMGTEDGRIVIMDIIDRCGLFSRSHGCDKPNATAYHDGIRDVAVWLREIVGGVAFDDLQLAEREFRSRREELDKQLEKESKERKEFPWQN